MATVKSRIVRSMFLTSCLTVIFGIKFLNFLFKSDLKSKESVDTKTFFGNENKAYNF